MSPSPTTKMTESAIVLAFLSFLSTAAEEKKILARYLRKDKIIDQIILYFDMKNNYRIKD